MQLLLDADLQETPRLETGKLITRLEGYAKHCGFDLPGEWALRRIIEDARGGVLGRSAGGHGRRAAEVDAVPHETLPYERPHECWTEDEFVLPLWVGMWHATKSQWISTMIYVALVLDYVSRAILAWHVCDPRRRRGSAREPVFTGFDEQDIATVFLKAARPELAPDLLVPFTGFLPEHIRMDAHATHHQWRMSVKAHIPTAIHILSAYRPYRNGIQERCGFTVKEEFDAFFAGTPGHVSTHLPTDRIRQNQHEARVQAASTTERPGRKIEILPEDLPRIEDVDAIIMPHLVRYYNYERTHSAHGMTPYDAFMSQRPRRSLLTPSDPLLRTLPVEVITATKGSLQFQRDKKVHLFDHRIEGRILPVGTSATVHVHPLAHCVWAVEDSGRRLVHIPSLKDASKVRDAKFVARARAELTGGLSERAQRALNALVEHRVGPERLDETREAAERNIAGDPPPKKSATPDGHQGTANLMDLIAASSMAPVAADEVWLGDAEQPQTPATATVEPYVIVTSPDPFVMGRTTTATTESPATATGQTTRAASVDTKAPTEIPRASTRKSSARRPRTPTTEVTLAPAATPASSFWLTGIASPLLQDAAPNDHPNVRRTS